MIWTDGNGYFHGGDQQPNERQATSAEVAAWEASKVTLEAVQGECQRRIDLAVNLNQKLNLLGTMMAMLLAITMLGQTASDDQKADAELFIRSMSWITSMRANCVGLVGRIDYTLDDNWPALSEDLKTFGAQF